MTSIIGVGTYGMVIKPSINCINGANQSNDTIGKISTIDILQQEYDFIINFPKLKNSPILDLNVSLCNLKKEAIDIIPKNRIFETTEKDLYQLSMPYLGDDLLKYLLTFKNPFNNKLSVLGDLSTSNNLMNVKCLKNLINALYILYEGIVEMNDRQVYHQDIKPNNIIYNVGANKMSLIDFNLSVNIKVPLYFSNHQSQYSLNIDDKIQFLDVLKKVLYLSLNNDYIYTNCKNTICEIDKLISEINHIQTGIKTYNSSNSSNIRNDTLKINELINEIFKMLNTQLLKLDENAITIENTTLIMEFPFCKFKIPKIQQQQRASNWNKSQINIKQNINDMENEDININANIGGKLKTLKLKKNKIKLKIVKSKKNQKPQIKTKKHKLKTKKHKLNKLKK